MIPGQAGKILPQEIAWVLGGGQFGRRAVEQLKRTIPGIQVVVVDVQPVGGLPSDVEAVCADGVEWLAKHLTPDAVVSRIVPALPVHLAAEWLRIKLTDKQGCLQDREIPDDVLSRLPHPVRLGPSQIALSHADFLCPPDCVEPGNLCTHTRQPRPLSMYRLLETFDCGAFNPLIVRSYQFGPGTGGFFPEQLWNLLARVRQLHDLPLLVGSACKCHGIVDGLCYLKY